MHNNVRSDEILYMNRLCKSIPFNINYDLNEFLSIF